MRTRTRNLSKPRGLKPEWSRNTSATLSPSVSELDHIAGKPDSRVTLVEFGDYQCPYCGIAFSVVKQLQRDLAGKLRFVFRNFPLTEVHPYAALAAQAAEAAALQGKFWEMHDIIFENQERLDPSNLSEWARQIGLDLYEFEKGIREKQVAERIRNDLRSGGRSGVDGTPFFFINGFSFDEEPDYEQLRKALDE